MIGQLSQNSPILVGPTDNLRSYVYHVYFACMSVMGFQKNMDGGWWVGEVRSI